MPVTKECESDELPPVVLNKHCQICDFQTRCRGIAVNREDLSLLATMTEKERQKFIEKGITTITQLSYGYRPRRRRRSKLTPSRVSPLVKYDNKLKAIAIKKGQVHVIGAPKFGGDGTLVFIDVEGMPDRDLYYLIGLRYQDQGRAVNVHSGRIGPKTNSRFGRTAYAPSGKSIIHGLSITGLTKAVS
jgi:predicted RecB family nuclease